MHDAIVFERQDDGSWIVLDHGPDLVMFCKYRTGDYAPLCLAVFQDGWPAVYRFREC